MEGLFGFAFNLAGSCPVLLLQVVVDLQSLVAQSFQVVGFGYLSIVALDDLQVLPCYFVLGYSIAAKL